jgi:predicted phage tail protein
MNFSYHEMKEALYILQSVLGVLLIIISITLFNTGGGVLHPICNVVPAVVLMVIGSSCVFFGVETYLLRDDPDIWR